MKRLCRVCPRGAAPGVAVHRYIRVCLTLLQRPPEPFYCVYFGGEVKGYGFRWGILSVVHAFRGRN